MHSFIVSVPAGKKEALVLSANSLGVLAKAVHSKGMVVAMYLNIPTTKLVNMQLDADEKNTSSEDRCLCMLQAWKRMRAGAKDRDRVHDLIRGIKEAGFVEMADVLEERSKDNIELTPDSIPVVV